MAIDKVLRIDGASITWTCKQIAKMIEKDTIGFDNEVQRGEVWERWRMSELVWSIIMGYPIPPIYCERGTDSENDKMKYYDCLDGKQRCTTIYKFQNDMFALTELSPISYLDENGEEQDIDISGKKFSELDEELQDIIRDATITVRYYDNLNQSKKAEMFRRLNQGKALSAKSRTLASAKNIGELLDIGSHEIFAQMLTDKARASKNQAIIVVKAWTMLNEEVINVSFASKDFNPMIESINISDKEKQELVKVFDFAVGVHEELIGNHEKSVAKYLFRETHFISIVPFIKIALENEITEAIFAEWLIDFFKTNNDTDVYAEYMNACKQAVASNASIMARHESLEKSYEEFFKVEDSENDESENNEGKLATV